MALNVHIVDDSAVTRTILVRTLQLARVPVTTIVEAENGREALAAMKCTPPDLVIVDINMPVMSGVEVIDEMNGDPDLCEIPVIVVSTEGSSTRIESLRAKGIKAYVRKPFTPEGIRNTLKEVLGDWEDDPAENAA